MMPKVPLATSIISPVPFVTAKRAFKSPLRYPGGKQRAIEQISKMLPESASEFREPMVGGGASFFMLGASILQKLTGLMTSSKS